VNQQRDNNDGHFCLKPLTAGNVEHIAVWYEDIDNLALGRESGDVNIVDLLTQAWDHPRGPLSYALENRAAVAFSRETGNECTSPLTR